MLELSIVIPVYNVAPYLPACLESVFGQTGFSFEVILVDDASTDNSGSICGEYARRYPQVRYIRHARNGGLSSARNTGLVAARGKYITFVDSDDFLASDTLTANMELLRTHADVDILEYPVQVYHGAENSYCYKPSEQIATETYRQWIERGGYRYSYAWNKIYRRTLWQGLTFPDGLYFEDLYVVPLVMQRAGKILAVPTGLYFYRSRSGSITTQVSLPKRLDLFHAALELYQRLLAEPGWLPETLDRLYLYTMDRQIEVLQSGGVTELPSRRSVIRMFWSSGVPLPARFKALLGGILGQKACSVYCFICKMLHV